MARLAGSSCFKKPTTIVPLLMALVLLSSAALSSAEDLRKKKPECRKVDSCEPSWCDGQCRQWGFTDPVGAYCTYGGTLTRCCCGSIGAGGVSASSTGDLHLQQQNVHY